ncbi:hypothetical protein [Cellulomonas sp. Root137]|uniref:hypothetical protein n=1 Tax=Cellulomonas sp. Root137 TaxID=1736459 RepID=UPI0006F826F8|nr:hypothetical protein [Cellulomonas sp. Root137]KQY45987.1 hypothetical protein ASD18_00370 [Cellulomonas sp. Root137]
MTSTRRRVGPSPERLFWAGSLVALAVASMVASARFADQAAAGTGASRCDTSAVTWGYEVEISPRTGSYSLAGARFDRVPAECAGAEAVILYRDADQVQHRSRVVLVAGLVDQLDPGVWTAYSLTAASWGIVDDL